MGQVTNSMHRGNIKRIQITPSPFPAYVFMLLLSYETATISNCYKEPSISMTFLILLTYSWNNYFYLATFENIKCYKELSAENLLLLINVIIISTSMSKYDQEELVSNYIKKLDLPIFLSTIICNIILVSTRSND